MKKYQLRLGRLVRLVLCLSFLVMFVFISAENSLVEATADKIPFTVETRDFSVFVSVPEAQIGNYVLRSDRVKLPYVTSGGAVAERINADMDGIVQAMTGSYEEVLRTMEGPGPSARYDFFEGSGVKSLVVRYRFPGAREEALVYNISETSGELLTQGDFIRQWIGEDLSPELLAENVRIAARIYHRSAPDEQLEALIAASGELHAEKPEATLLFAFGPARIGFVYPLRMQSGGQRLALGDLSYGSQVNPQHPDFAKLAAAFHLNDPNLQAIVVPLGGAYTAEMMRPLFFRLYNGIETYNLSNSPAYYARMENGYLIGHEHYYVIPRERDAVVKLTPVELTEAGDIVSSSKLAPQSFTGPVLISMNMSDIYANVEITLGDLVFSPYVSLKDGSLVLPPEVAEVQFDWRNMVEQQDPGPQGRLWEEVRPGFTE